MIGQIHLDSVNVLSWQQSIPELHTVDITLSSEMPRAESLVQYRDLFFKHMY